MASPRAVVALLSIVLLAAGAIPAAAQSGLEIMKRQRELQHVRDEEERQVLKLVSKSGATKDRKLVRYVLSGANDLDKILVRFQAPRDVENTALLTARCRRAFGASFAAARLWRAAVTSSALDRVVAAVQRPAVKTALARLMAAM